MNRRFDLDKLEVFQVSLDFIAWLEPIILEKAVEKPLISANHN